MPPIILSATASRLEKLEKAPLYVPIRIKIPGSKLEITTVMRNPFFVALHGDGFDLSKAVKSVGNAIHKVEPAIDKASDMGVLLGTVSGQPELAAVGAVGKALATSTTALMGGVKKNEQISLYHYGRALKIIVDHLGNTRTTQRQLDRLGRKLFPRWRGIFAKGDAMPDHGYWISNTGTRASGGIHWMAHVDDIIYDSFGREAYGDLSGDAEQAMLETNCGQGSLAWLWVCHTHGVAAAKLI